MAIRTKDLFLRSTQNAEKMMVLRTETFFARNRPQRENIAPNFRLPPKKFLSGYVPGPDCRSTTIA